jgi:hypothetical protein
MRLGHAPSIYDVEWYLPIKILVQLIAHNNGPDILAIDEVSPVL